MLSTEQMKHAAHARNAEQELDNLIFNMFREGWSIGRDIPELTLAEAWEHFMSVVAKKLSDEFVSGEHK